MKPFLLLSTRPEDDAALGEWEAIAAPRRASGTTNCSRSAWRKPPWQRRGWTNSRGVPRRRTLQRQRHRQVTAAAARRGGPQPRASPRWWSGTFRSSASATESGRSPRSWAASWTAASARTWAWSPRHSPPTAARIPSSTASPTPSRRSPRTRRAAGSRRRDRRARHRRGVPDPGVPDRTAGLRHPVPSGAGLGRPGRPDPHLPRRGLLRSGGHRAAGGVRRVARRSPTPCTACCATSWSWRLSPGSRGGPASATGGAACYMVLDSIWRMRSRVTP